MQLRTLLRFWLKKWLHLHGKRKERKRTFYLKSTLSTQIDSEAKATLMLQEIPENPLYLCSKQTSQRSSQNARKAFFMGTAIVTHLVSVIYFANKQNSLTIIITEHSKILEKEYCSVTKNSLLQATLCSALEWTSHPLIIIIINAKQLKYYGSNMEQLSLQN